MTGERYDSQEDILGIVDDITRSLSLRMDELTDKVNELKSYANRLEAEETLSELAYSLTMDSIVDTFESIIEFEVLSACIKTVEYNYGRYVDHLLDAIQLNINDLVSIKPSRYSNPEVSVNFKILGDVSLWGEVVTKAYELIVKENAQGSSKFHGSRGVPIKDVSVRSRIWMEKVYKTAREGGSVSKTRKVRSNNAGKSIWVEETVDITDRYSELYERTISKRLSLLPSNKAPYWYIIDKGNASTKIKGHSGTPYPIFPPTNMTENIAKSIERNYIKLYNDYLGEVRELISNNFNEERIVDIINKKVTNLEQTDTELDKVIDYGIEVIKLADSSIEFYRRNSGKVGYNVRGAGGRFISKKLG